MFADYTDKELERLAIAEVRKAKLTMSRSVRSDLVKAVSVQRFAPHFGNAGTLITMLCRAKERMLARDPISTDILREDLDLQTSSTTDPVEFLATLHKTEHVVRELRSLQATVRQCERDNKDPSFCLRNYLFLGNPGTGKTQMAQIFAKILHALGILSREKVVVHTGQDLQGSYVGQTKDRVNEAFAEAQGGVLFIDEAYTLGNNTTIYAKEAVDQIIALMMTPEHHQRTVVILAGSDMESMMRTSNEGLRSRFTGRLDFPNWDAEDALTYLRVKCDKESHVLSSRCEDLLRTFLTEIVSQPDWSNARDCITIYDLLYTSLAERNEHQPPTRDENSNACFNEDDVELMILKWRHIRPISAPRHDVAATQRTQSTPFAAAVEDLEVECNASNSRPFLPPPHPAAFAMQQQLQDTLVRPPSPPPMAFQSPIELENVVEEEIQEDWVRVSPSEQHKADIITTDGDIDPLFKALLDACREAGYDRSHEDRQRLVVLLEAVQDEGAAFPEDIMQAVVTSTGRSELEVTQHLRPQVHRVLSGMRNAIVAEEKRREELKRLKDAEERAAAVAREEAIQSRLRVLGPCPMGFSWHRCGSTGGWRCAGGSHYVSDSELDRYFHFA